MALRSAAILSSAATRACSSASARERASCAASVSRRRRSSASCPARRLRLGLGARIGDAPQLDFRRLALARHVQPTLLLAQLCLRRLAGAALGLDAVALHSGAHALRLLQLVEQLAHLLDLALALSAAAALRRAGEKSRLIMSPSASE